MIHKRWPAAWPVQRAVAERWLALTGCPVTEELRPFRDLAGGDRQPLQLERVHRHDRPAASLDEPRIKRSATTRATTCRSVRSARSCIRGPQVMAGYWDRPRRRQVMTKDGFAATGDIGRMDERGFVTIVDSKKDA